ncbi:MAG: WXG100 family type VII secretion target [Nocardioides sp.]
MSNAPEYGQGEGTLTRAAGLVSDARADFNNISSRLTDQIAGVQSKWGGQGASAFFVLHQAWTEKQQTIVNALDEFANSLTSTERINTSTDDEQGSNFGRLTSKLGG